MILYGTLDRKQLVQSELATCARCGAESLHDVERRYRVAVLWLPIFSFAERFVGQCGHCLLEYPVSRVAGPLPKRPVIDRFGGLFVALVLGLPLAIAAWAMFLQAPSPDEYQEPQKPTGERVLAALERELRPGKSAGLDPRCAKLAAEVRAALTKLPDFGSDALAVACARVRPRDGASRTIFVARVPKLEVDRKRLSEAAHAINRGLDGKLDDHHEIVWAVAAGETYTAVAKGAHRGAWRLQTDPHQVRGLLVDALSY